MNNDTLSNGNWHPSINPRCEMERSGDFIGADGYVRPCCYVYTLPGKLEFEEWLNIHNADIEDFNIYKFNHQEILNSNAKETLRKGFRSGDVPAICTRECGNASWSSTNNISKWSNYE